MNTPINPSRYAILDDNSVSGQPEKFRIPEIQCGDYVATGLFGEEYKFAVRRMPRRARYTGSYGLFYDDPDAGDILIAVLRDETFECTAPMHNLTLQNFTGPKKLELIAARCCWCGRKLLEGQTKIHPNCTKLSQSPAVV